MGVGLPVKATVNETLLVAQITWLAGCVVMFGAVLMTCANAGELVLAL